MDRQTTHGVTVHDRTEAAGTGAVPAVAPAWFGALFALAVAAHIVGNPPASLTLRVVTTGLAVAALTLVWRPESRLAWAAVSTLVPVTAWLEAPLLGNHWLLMTAFAAATLLAQRRKEPWPWLAATVRLTFLSFYGFAAFAKLNTAFFDPTVSCAVVYANQTLRSWGLPVFASDAVAVSLPAAAAMIELSVPLLLLFARTRAAGVALAAAFHVVITLDLAQHFYDFTAVLLLGLLVFADDAVTGAIAAWLDRRRASLAALSALWAVLMLVMLVPSPIAARVAARLVVVAVWLPVSGAIVWLTMRAAGRPVDVRLRPYGAAAAVLTALVVLNGVLPYTGVKTATGWNMYANLVTVDGRSNHLLVSPAAAVAHPSYVRLTATNDDALEAYISSGWDVPERNLRDYLASRPAATVTYVRPDGTTVSGNGATLGRPLPEVTRRALPLRSVPTSQPAPCQQLWLPAL